MTQQERDLQNIFGRQAADIGMLSENTSLTTAIDAGITNAKLDVLNKAKEEKLGRLSNAWKPAMIESITDADSMQFVGVTGGTGGMDKVTGQKYDLTGKPTEDRIDGFDAYEVPHPGDPYKNSRTGIKKFNEQRSRLAKELGVPVDTVTDNMIYQAGTREQLMALYNAIPGKKAEWTPGPLDFVNENTPLVLGSKEHPLNIQVERKDVGANEYFGRPLTNVRNKDTKETVQEGLGYKDESKNAQQLPGISQYVGVGDKLLHGAKIFGRTLYDTAISQPAAFIEETVTGDKIDEKDRSARLDAMFGINSLDKQLAAEGQARRDAKSEVIFDSRAKTRDRVSAAVDVVTDAITDTGAWGSSMGTLVGWLAPGAAAGKVMKAAKFAAIESEVVAGTISAAAGNAAKLKVSADLATKTSTLSRAQIGHVNAAVGEVNQQYKEFVVNNGGKEPEGGKAEFFAKALPVQMVNQNLDAFVDMTILKSPAVIGALGEVIVGATNKQMATMAKGIGKTIGAVGVGMVSEAGQEYTQTMMELFNTRYGSETFKDTSEFTKFITDKRNYEEASMAALQGAGGSVQFGISSLPVSGVTAVADKLLDKVVGVSEPANLTPEQQAILDSGEPASMTKRQEAVNAVKDSYIDKSVEGMDFLGADEIDELKQEFKTLDRDGIQQLANQMDEVVSSEDPTVTQTFKDIAKAHSKIYNDMLKYHDNSDTETIANKELYKSAHTSLKDGTATPENIFKGYAAGRALGKKVNLFEDKIIGYTAAAVDKVKADKKGTYLNEEEEIADVERIIDATIANSGLTNTSDVDALKVAMLASGKFFSDKELGSLDRFAGSSESNPNVASGAKPENSKYKDEPTIDKGKASDTTEAVNEIPTLDNFDGVRTAKFSKKVDDGKNRFTSSETDTADKATDTDTASTNKGKKKEEPKYNAEREGGTNENETSGFSTALINKYARIFKLKGEDVATALDMAVTQGKINTFKIANMKSVNKAENEKQYALWYDDNEGILPNYIRYKKANMERDTVEANKALKKIVDSGYKLDVLKRHYDAAIDTVKSLADEFIAGGASVDESIELVNDAIADGEISNRVRSKTHNYTINVGEVVRGETGNTMKIYDSIVNNIEQIKKFVNTTDQTFKEAKGKITNSSEETTRKSEVIAKYEEQLKELANDTTKSDDVKTRLAKAINNKIATVKEEVAKTSIGRNKMFVEAVYEQEVDTAKTAGHDVTSVSKEAKQKMQGSGIDTDTVVTADKAKKELSESDIVKKVKALKDKKVKKAELTAPTDTPRIAKVKEKIAKVVDRINKERDAFTVSGKASGLFKDKRLKLGVEFRAWSDKYIRITNAIDSLEVKAEAKLAEVKKADKALKVVKQRLVKLNEQVGGDILSINETAPTSLILAQVKEVVIKLGMHTKEAAKLLALAIKYSKDAYNVEKLKKEYNTVVSELNSNIDTAKLVEDEGRAIHEDYASKHIRSVLQLSKLTKQLAKVRATDTITKERLGRQIDKLEKELVSGGILAKSIDGGIMSQVVDAPVSTTRVINGKEVEGKVQLLDLRKAYKLTGSLLNSLPLASVKQLIEDKEAVEHLVKQVAKIKEAFKKAITIETNAAGVASYYEIYHNPALGFMLDKDGNLTDQAALILAVGIDDYFGNMGSSFITNTDDEIARMRGLEHPGLLDKKEKELLRHGKFTKVVTAQVGGHMQSLFGVQMKGTTEISNGLADKVKSGFGHIGLTLAKELGYIKDMGRDNGISEENMDAMNNVTAGKKITADKEDKSDTSYVSMVKAAKKKSEFYQTIAKLVKPIQGALKFEEVRKTFRQAKRKIEDKVFEIRNGLTSVPAKSQEILKKLTNDPYTINKDGVKAFAELTATEEGVKSVKKDMGYVELSEMKGKATLDAIEQQEAINNGIETAVDSFIQLQKDYSEGKVTDEVYFDWFFSTNGRYFMDTVAINPQTEKYLHRWLVTGKANQRVWDISKEGSSEEMFFNQGIAQAFGFDIDKKGTEDANVFARFVRGLTDADISGIIRGEGIDEDGFYKDSGIKVKVPHIGHALQAQGALRKMREAIDKKGNIAPFETVMTVEYDEATSGFALKLGQLPFSDLEKTIKWLAKTGIVVQRDGDNGALTFRNEDGEVISRLEYLDKNGDPLGANDIIAQPGFLDSYRTLAMAVNTEMEKLSEKDELVGEDAKDKLKVKSHEIFKYAVNPKNDVIAPIVKDGEVTSFGRSLFKYPFMMFNYGASLFTLQKRIGLEIATKIIDDIAAGKYDDNAEFKKLIIPKDTDQQWASLKESLVGVVGKDGEFVKEPVYASAIQMSIGGKSIDLVTLLSKTFSDTYGEAFVNMMESEFGEITAANNIMIKASQIMFKVFDAKYKEAFVEKVNELNPDLDGFDTYDQYIKFIKQDKNKGLLHMPTAKEESAILDSLADVFPAIKAYHSESRKDGIGIISSETVSNENNPFGKVQTPQTTKKDKNPRYHTIGTMLRQYKEAVAAGAVLPTHYQDGTSIGEALIKGGVLGIHDAIVLGHSHEEYVLAVNKGIADVSLGYNTVREYLSALTGVLEAGGVTADWLADQEIGTSEDSKLSGTEVLMALVELDVKVDRNRKELFSHKIQWGNMVAPKGVHTSEAVSNGNYDILSNIIEIIKEKC